MSWEPGNPKGWGDPTPLVLLILLLIVLGAIIDRTRFNFPRPSIAELTPEQEQQCREFFNIP